MIRPGVVAAAAIVDLGATDAPFALAVNAAVIEDTLALLELWPGGPRIGMEDLLPPHLLRLFASEEP